MSTINFISNHFFNSYLKKIYLIAILCFIFLNFIFSITLAFETVFPFGTDYNNPLSYQSYPQNRSDSSYITFYSSHNRYFISFDQIYCSSIGINYPINKRFSSGLNFYHFQVNGFSNQRISGQIGIQANKKLNVGMKINLIRKNFNQELFPENYLSDPILKEYSTESLISYDIGISYFPFPNHRFALLFSHFNQPKSKKYSYKIPQIFNFSYQFSYQNTDFFWAYLNTEKENYYYLGSSISFMNKTIHISPIVSLEAFTTVLSYRNGNFQWIYQYQYPLTDIHLASSGSHKLFFSYQMKKKPKQIQFKPEKPISKPKIEINLISQTDTIEIINQSKISQISPLLKTVFFKENSALLDSTKYILYQSKQEKDSLLKLDQIPQQELYQQYQQVINIIAQQLLENPNAKIMLHAFCNPSSDFVADSLLMQKRAESIQDYIGQVYEVDPQRMQIKINHDSANLSPVWIEQGREENRRVDFIIPSSLLIPLTHTVETFQIKPDTLTFVPVLNHIADSFDLQLIMLDSNLAKIDSFKIDNADSIQISTPSNIFQFSSIQYQLILKKQENQKFKSPVRTIAIKKNKKKEIVQKEKFTLMMFDYNTTKTDLHKIDQFIDKIFEKLNQNSNSYLEIRGYTDEIGDEAYNLKLSTQRAMMIKDALTQKGIAMERLKVEGLGDQSQLMPNNTPEGRFFNRRVEIIWNNPLEK